MSRHVIDQSRTRNSPSRLRAYLRIDRESLRRDTRVGEDRTRGATRLKQFLRIERGRTV